MFCEPLAGKRSVWAEEHRTMIDWAHKIQHLLDVEYPDAKKVILVSDNPAILILRFHDIEPLTVRGFYNS